MATTAPLSKLTEVAAPSSPKVEVDELDLALLRALATDARQSQRALARTVEMSPPAVADRLARLERNGAIRGYRVDIDWAALGFPVVVYLAVTAGPGMDLSEIIRAIRAIPEAQDRRVARWEAPPRMSSAAARSTGSASTASWPATACTPRSRPRRPRRPPAG